jgi:hypothetical protein
MINEPTQALHIIAGDFASGFLKRAFGLNSDRVLVNRDPIHWGPAPATDNLERWRDVRESFLRMAYQEEPLSLNGDPSTELISNLTRLGAEKHVLIWVARGLAEQLLLAWLVHLFDQQGFDPSRLVIIQVTNLRPRQKIMGMGELSSENFRTFRSGEQKLDAEQLNELKAAWSAYTCACAEALTDHVSGSTHLPLLREAMRSLICRYPDHRSGLSLCDTKLLEHTAEHGPLTARIIGYAMGDNETPDQVGDSYLFYRLLRLGSPNLPSPLVSFTGDTNAIRTCSVEITDFGRKVLAGQANHVAENGIDDWIGGVHLTPDTVVFRDGDRLLLS